MYRLSNFQQHIKYYLDLLSNLLELLEDTAVDHIDAAQQQQYRHPHPRLHNTDTRILDYTIQTPASYIIQY